MYCQNKIISLMILICCCKLINISNAKPQHNRHSISSSITTKTSHKDSKHSKHTSSNNNGINKLLRKNSHKSKNGDEKKETENDGGGGRGEDQPTKEKKNNNGDNGKAPQNQQLPGGNLVAPLPQAPVIGATPPNSHAGPVLGVSNMPEHKIPQEQPMTVNSYTDNSGGNAPPTQPVASPQGVRPTAFIEAPMIKDQDERIKVLIADVAKLSAENDAMIHQLKTSRISPGK